MEFEQLLPTIQEYSIKYGLALLEAVLIFVIGKFAAGIVANIIDKVMKRSGMDDMLRKFLRNIAYAVLLVFVVIAAISSLGIQTASLVAVLGAAGLAIGLALQGSLANFAAGVLMIIFRPYKLGDLVCVADTTGFVEEVDVFTTTCACRTRPRSSFLTARSWTPRSPISWTRRSAGSIWRSASATATTSTRRRGPPGGPEANNTSWKPGAHGEVASLGTAASTWPCALDQVVHYAPASHKSPS